MNLATLTNGSCSRHGPYATKNWRDPCPACAREEAATLAADRLAAATEKAGIPPRFRGKGFDAFKPSSPAQERALAQVRHYVANFDEALTVGRCLILIGRPGVGKTHLAMAVLQSLLVARRTVEYHTTTSLIRRVRETWGAKDGPSESALLRAWGEMDLLVIDEIGVQYGTDAERLSLFEVINARYLNLKPMIIVGNCTREELATHLGERALDRLRENGGELIVMDGASARGQKVAP